ncbi:hypothetical protein [Aliiroseovarius subalbicans]|uniref:DUF6990 domain-containing protein n=1 Tax=Aliiroseovarius subalbicans TaxID=2925840 RepID=UPI001F57DF40|nr:hypothetical protein [Aliiroseovarius subalbicans]MCI2400286.1 hypothetical protein [Aliiroseovarius subalbicans]
MAEWQALVSQPDWVPSAKVTRRDVERELRAQGFKRRTDAGETVFERTDADRSLSISLTLKTFPETERTAPMQRLSLTGAVAGKTFQEVEAAIRGVTTARVGQAVLTAKSEDFFLTEQDVAGAISDLAMRLTALNLDDRLATFRAYAPSQPGIAGLHHLVALALAGQVEQLEGYARRRADGGDAGFVPYISDGMITRARDLARDRFSA